MNKIKKIIAVAISVVGFSNAGFAAPQRETSRDSFRDPFVIQDDLVTKTWVGGSGLFWNTANNWNPTGTPANGDDLRFYGGPNSTSNNSTYNPASLYLSEHVTNFSAGTVVTNLYAVGVLSESSVSVVRSGAVSSLGDVYIGAGDGSLGRVEVSAGTFASVGSFISVGNNATSIGTLSISGGVVSTPQLQIAYYGDGRHYQDGGTLNAGIVTMATVAGSQAYMRLEDGGINSDIFLVGFGVSGGSSAYGTLEQTGGSIVASEYLDVGEAATGVGTYVLTGGSLAAGEFVVGFQGTGTFQQSGGTVTCGYFYVGPGGNATLNSGALSAATIEFDNTLDITGHEFATTNDVRSAIRTEILDGDLIATATNAVVGYSDTVVRATRNGDVNLDRIVNINDQSIIGANWNTSGKFWNEGDLNHDGNVNIQDFSIMASNFGYTFPRQANVPEPALGLVLTSLYFLNRKR